jgi:hypothetical protein
LRRSERAERRARKPNIRESKLDFTLPFNPGRLTLNDYEGILADIRQ